jgi:pimeloyl-ACP methyl ester carboxylesterase
METRKAAIESMFVPTTTPELRAEILATMLGTPRATAEGAMAAMMDPKNQSDRKIMAPAMTIWAGNSNFPDDGSTRELVPDWSSQKFDGTGHFVMMEQPARFNTALRTFIEQRAKF